VTCSADSSTNTTEPLREPRFETLHALGAPFFIAGTLKSVYDLGLYVLFRNVTVEGEHRREPAMTG
jgi:hypothetical protein